MAQHDANPLAAPGSLFRLIRRALIANYGAIAIGLASSAVTVPVLLKGLGADRYGAYTLAIAWAILLQLPFSGLETGATRMVSEYNAAGRLEELRRILAGSVTTIFAAAFAFCAAGALLGLALPSTVFPATLTTAAPNFPTILAIGCMGVPFRSLSLLLGGACRGLFHFRPLAAVNSVATILQAAGTIAIVWSGGGILPLLTFWSVLSAPVAAAQYALLRRALGQPLPMSFPRMSVVKHLGREAGWLGVEQAFHGAAMESDKFILSFANSAAQVGYYAIAFRIPLMLNVLANEYASLYMPVVAAADAQVRRKSVLSILVRANRHILLVFVPLAVFGAIWAPELLNIWIGSAHASDITPVFRVALLIVSFYAMQEVVFSILYGLNRFRESAHITAAQSVLRVALAITFAGRWGATGVATAVLISVIIGDTVVRTRTALRYLGVTFMSLVSPFFVPALIGTVVVSAGFFLAHSAKSVWLQAIGIATTLLLFVAINKVDAYGQSNEGSIDDVLTNGDAQHLAAAAAITDSELHLLD